MQFLTTLFLFTLSASAYMNMDGTNCGKSPAVRRSAGLTSKPREWLNAARGIDVDAAAPIEAAIEKV
jgi:hypothetical protein